MSPAFAGLSFGAFSLPTARAVGYWYGVGFADFSLLDLLQNPIGVIAGDERDVFVDL